MTLYKMNDKDYQKLYEEIDIKFWSDSEDYKNDTLYYLSEVGSDLKFLIFELKQKLKDPFYVMQYEGTAYMDELERLYERVRYTFEHVHEFLEEKC